MVGGWVVHKFFHPVRNKNCIVIAVVRSQTSQSASVVEGSSRQHRPQS